MSQATLANIQMSQAERKGKDIARRNTNNVQMNSLWSYSATHKHLIDYAKRLISEQ